MSCFEALVNSYQLPSLKNSLSSFINLAPAFEEPSPCASLGLAGGEIDPNCTDSGGPGSRLTQLRSLLVSARNAIGSNLTMQIGDGVLMF